MPQCIRIHPADNVAVALCPIPAGTRLSLEGRAVQMREDIRRDTKLALAQIAAGENIIKYGYPIGHAASDIPPGAWVHTTMCARTCPARWSTPMRRTCDPCPPCRPKHSKVTAGRTGAGVRNGTLDHSHRRLRERLRQGLGRGEPEPCLRFHRRAVCIPPSLRLFPRPEPTTPKRAAFWPRWRVIPMQAACWYCHWGCENLTHEQFAEELGPL